MTFSRRLFLTHAMCWSGAVCALARAAPSTGWVRGLAPKAAPTRLVSLAPSVTETLFALSLGPRVVGVTRFCDRPAQVASLPKVGGFSDPSLEAILALRPNAVVAVPSEMNRRVVERLVDLGVPVLLVPDTTVADVQEAVLVMGTQLGVPDVARALWAGVEARMDAVAARVRGAPRVRTLVAYDTRPWVVAGPGTFAHDVVERAGGTNVVPASAAAYPTLSVETLVHLDPDVVLDASMGARAASGASAVEVMLRPFTQMKAVKTGRVVALPPGVLARPGPSLGDDIELLASLLHPVTDGGQPRP